MLKAGGGDVGSLLKSITKDQWAIHKKQGFLKPSDLTDKQKKMLGIEDWGDGRNLSIDIIVDGKELKIRDK